MVRNIVMNALKFSPETGNITVTLSDGPDAEIILSDNAPSGLTFEVRFAQPG